jgi:uncharacterized protein YndB with AHSA1/START domain
MSLSNKRNAGSKRSAMHGATDAKEGDPMENGQLTWTDGRWQLEFVRRLPHPPGKVWRAITEPEHLAAWFPARIDGERAAGAPLRFVFPDNVGNPDPGDPIVQGEMLVYDPPSHLEYRWGEETLRFDVTPDGDGSVLTFVNRFDDQGKAARDGAGWHVCLDQLFYHLAGEEPPWDPDKQWQPVHAAYVERLGPEAATIGPPDWYTGG